MALALNGISDLLRSKTRNSTKPKEQKIYQALRDEISDILENNSIIIDDLIC
jgi:hypothetical protein